MQSIRDFERESIPPACPLIHRLTVEILYSGVVFSVVDYRKESSVLSPHTKIDFLELIELTVTERRRV